MRARNAAGSSAFSNQASANTDDEIHDPSAPCAPSATDMCLNDGRFKVEVDWRSFNDEIGVGKVVGGTPSDDSGIFYFFTPDNWEMLVKVLDVCDNPNVNPHFWVFFAATTDVEYTVTITDTQTSAVRQYSNPLGNAAAAITDTSAFATCP